MQKEAYPVSRAISTSALQPWDLFPSLKRHWRSPISWPSRWLFAEKLASLQRWPLRLFCETRCAPHGCFRLWGCEVFSFQQKDRLFGEWVTAEAKIPTLTESVIRTACALAPHPDGGCLDLSPAVLRCLPMSHFRRVTRNIPHFCLGEKSLDSTIVRYPG